MKTYEGTSALGSTPLAQPRAAAPRSAATARPRDLETPRLPRTRPESGRAARRKPRAAARAIPRPHMKISPRAVMLFFVAIALLMFIVYSHMQDSQIQSANQALQTELNALRREETHLRNQFESSVRLPEIERYATSELGMVKPGPDQIIYIDLGGEDRAVIIEQRTIWQSIRERMSSMLAAVRDIF